MPHCLVCRPTHASLWTNNFTVDQASGAALLGCPFCALFAETIEVSEHSLLRLSAYQKAHAFYHIERVMPFTDVDPIWLYWPKPIFSEEEQFHMQLDLNTESHKLQLEYVLERAQPEVSFRSPDRET